MKSFSITSPRFEGSVLVNYSSTGLMTSFTIEEGIQTNDKAHRWILERVPLCVQDLDYYRKQDHLVIKEFDQDLSFTRWFRLYGYPVSKKRAEGFWNRLSKADRIQAIEKAPKYEKWRMMKGHDKAYPDSWLSKRRFDDEFKMI